MTKPILKRYQRHLFYYRKDDGNPLVPGTQVNLLRAVKTFFKWATRENHILYNPASELDVPRVQRRLPRNILSVDEVAAILGEADPSTVTGLRDRALLELLYSTGLRRKEVGNLTRGDIDFIRQVVFVREGKGGRDRVVPLGARACAWLRKYLYEARPQLTVDGNLSFTGHSLGGGLASAQALKTNGAAIVFNAEGLSDGTLRTYKLDTNLANKNISAFNVNGEILSRLQDNPLSSMVTTYFGTVPKNVVAAAGIASDLLQGRESNFGSLGIPSVASALGRRIEMRRNAQR